MTRGRKDRFKQVDIADKLGPGVPRGIPWLDEAAYLYDHEGEAGIADGRRLVRLVNWIDQRSPIDLPWCGLFIGHCIRKACPSVRLPGLSFRARPWRRFGVPAEPQVGALLIFWQRWRNSPFGHIGFYWAEDDDSFHVLGGNQYRTILVERFPKDRLIDCRWPAGAPQPGIRRRHPPDHAEPFEGAESG